MDCIPSPDAHSSLSSLTWKQYLQRTITIRLFGLIISLRKINSIMRFSIVAATFLGVVLATPAPISAPLLNAKADVGKRDTIISWTGTCNRATNICTSSLSKLMYTCVSKEISPSSFYPYLLAPKVGSDSIFWYIICQCRKVDTAILLLTLLTLA